MVSLIFPLSLFSANYYIDAITGNDSDSGLSSTLAWKTLTKVNATTFQAGDSILFKTDGVWIGQLYPKGSGSAISPIVIDKYGDGSKPIFDGDGMTGTGVVYLYNQQYWEINNLEITNDAAIEGDRRGVRIEISNFKTANHIYLQNLYVHNIKGLVGQDRIHKRTAAIGFAILSVSTLESHFNDIIVRGCTIKDCENQGIITECVSGDGYQPGSSSWNRRKITNALIENNIISGISKNAMILRLFEGGLVQNNVCYDTANGVSGNTIYSIACLNTVFQFNECFENHSPDDHDGSMYDADLRSPGTIWQYSYSHDNNHGLFVNCTVQADDSVVCRYNISQNDRGIIFCINYPVTNINIYNNTVYIPSHLSPIIISERNNGDDGTRTYNFKNNIIYNNSAKSTYIINKTYTRFIDYNCFYGYHPINEPADNHKIKQDPMFENPGSGGQGLNTVDGYKLQAGSPCIGTGVFIPNNGGRDYWGNPLLTTLPDIGAFESTKITNLSKYLFSKSEIVSVNSSSENNILKATLSGFDIPENANVQLLTITGQSLYSQQLQVQDKLVIKLPSRLLSGNYILSIKTENSHLSKKFIQK